MNILSNLSLAVSGAIKKYIPPAYIVREASGRDGVDGRVITYVDRFSHVAEQYKTLRTNLYSLSPENPIKTVVITSSQAWEGKTITCCNLAVTLSYDKDKKVALIDADLRKPAIHTMFNLPYEPGFSDILRGEATLEELTARPAIGDLYIIPAGSVIDDPADILGPAVIEPFIKKAKEKFDYILFDTPPVLEFTDASSLGSLCDAVVPVVKAASTQEHAIREAFDLLREAQAAPKACILTNALHLLDSHYHFYKYKKARPAGK